MCDYESWLWNDLYLLRTVLIFNYFWFMHRNDISYFPYQLLIIIKYLRNQLKTLFLCFILWNKVKERLDYFVFVFIIWWSFLFFIRDLLLVIQYLFYLFTDINFILGFICLKLIILFSFLFLIYFFDCLPACWIWNLKSLACNCLWAISLFDEHV